MKIILLTVITAGCVFAQPTPTTLIGPVYDAFSNPYTGSLTIQSLAKTNQGFAIVGTGQPGRIVYVTAGTINGLSLIPNDTSVPPSTAYLATFGNGDVWVCQVPTSSSPVDFTSACAPNPNPPNSPVPVPPSQIIPGTQNNQVLSVVLGTTQWASPLEWSTTATLTASQVDGMYAAPQLLIAAAGVGTLILPRACVFNARYGSAAFTGGGALGLYYGTGGTTLATSSVASTLLTTFSANQSAFVGGFTGVPLSSVAVNAPVYISNATQGFAGGTGASMLVTCYYSILTGVQ